MERLNITEQILTWFYGLSLRWKIVAVCILIHVILVSIDGGLIAGAVELLFVALIYRCVRYIKDTKLYKDTDPKEYERRRKIISKIESWGIIALLGMFNVVCVFVDDKDKK